MCVTVGNRGWQVPWEDAAPAARRHELVGILDEPHDPMRRHVDAEEAPPQKEVDHIGVPGVHEHDFRDHGRQPGLPVAGVVPDLLEAHLVRFDP